MKTSFKHVLAIMLSVLLMTSNLGLTVFAEDFFNVEPISEQTEDPTGQPADGEEAIEGEGIDGEQPLMISMAMESIAEEMPKPVAFDQSQNVNGVIVRVKAAPGVFPMDAELSVKSVPVYKQRQADAAIGEVRDGDQNVVVSYTFDIKIIDPVTREAIQPAEDQTVNVSFALAEVGDQNLTASIYHIDQSGTAEKLDVVQEDEVTAAVETEGFSLYTVEFTYNNLEYVLPGDTSVLMSKILSALGLTGEVTAVEISDTSLFSASDESGEWVVYAHQAFDTTEWMKVSINGVAYEITVTDDAEYYLIGTMSDWKVDEQYKLAAHPEIDNLYYITSVELEEDSEFKVVSPSGGGYNWYPDKPENYKIEDWDLYDIYFRPNSNGADSWFYGCFQVVHVGGMPDLDASSEPATTIHYYLERATVGTESDGSLLIAQNGDWTGATRVYESGSIAVQRDTSVAIRAEHNFPASKVWVSTFTVKDECIRDMASPANDVAEFTMPGYDVYVNVFFSTSQPGQSGEITIYFLDTMDWGNAYIQYRGGSSNPSWPGKKMTVFKENYEGHTLYKAAIPPDVTGIGFSDGNNWNTTSVDIDSGIVNGAAWYISGAWASATLVEPVVHAIAIGPNVHSSAVTFSVDGEPVAEAAADDTVTLVPAAGSTLLENSVSAVYTDWNGQTHPVDLTRDAQNNYTFAMPGGPVTVSATVARDVGIDMTVDVESLVLYTGSTVTPKVRVVDHKNGDAELTQGTDYTVSYTNNKGSATDISEATATVTGIGAYTGTATKTFRITPFNIANCQIKGTLEVYDDGHSPYYPLSSNVEVWNGETKLTLDTDYSLDIENADFYEVGQAYDATITGQGKWGGTQTFQFTIVALHHTVAFDPGEGSGTMAGGTVANDGSNRGKFYLPECTFTPPTGKTFGHWEVSDGEESYEVEQDEDGFFFFAPYIYNESDVQTITVTAVWEDAVPAFKTHSLVLTGLIGINFFMDLPKIGGVDYTTSYMTFRLGGTGKSASTDAFNASDKNEAGTYYGFTCYVTSIEMADTITAVFHYTEGGAEKTIAQNYSVAQYIADFDAVSSNYSATTVAAVHSLADLGHYVQPVLAAENHWALGTDHAEMAAYHTGGYDNSEVKAVKNAVENYAVVRDTVGSKVEAVTYRLQLDASTTVSLYLRPVSGYEESIAAYLDGGTSNVAALQADGRYRIQIPDISAHELGYQHKIRVVADKEFTITVYALSYIHTVLNSATYANDADMINAMVSLYKYYDAVMAYRKQ